MVNYSKPLVLVNEDLAEGVYAASGSSTDCWDIWVDGERDWTGLGHGWRVHAKHKDTMEHISTATTVVLTFSAPIASATAQEYSVTVSGNTVTVVRDRHGNAYQSGDNYDYWLEVNAIGGEAATKALTLTGYTIECSWDLNVQGGGANKT